jgi:hypothetical protein
MRDLREYLTGVWSAASQLPAAEGVRVVQFMAARAGEGTSSLAASFARMVAETSSRPVWLLDTDFSGNPLYSAFAKGTIPGMGRPGRPLDASLGTEQIYRVDGAQGDPALAKLLTVHQIEDSRLFVTRFRNERLGPGQAVHHVAAPEWWAALRLISSWVVIDAPALSQSALGLRHAQQADGVVLVIKADSTPAEEVSALRASLETAGANILGAVLNRAAGKA